MTTLSNARRTGRLSGKKLQKENSSPIDIDQTTEDDFRGISDIEMSYMLLDTTEKERNVTTILDYCFSGRMVRGPSHGIKLVSKYRPTTGKYNIPKHVKWFWLDAKLQGEILVGGNPKAVRIAAAATTEEAYEYKNWQGQKRRAIDRYTCWCNQWNNLQGRIMENRLTACLRIVHTKFSTPRYLQHPQTDGPDTWILSSTKKMVSGAKLITMENGEAIPQAGSVAGVLEGNVYAIMSYGFESIDSQTQIARGKVIHISGFKSKLELTFTTLEGSIPSTEAPAFLQTKAPYK